MLVVWLVRSQLRNAWPHPLQWGKSWDSLLLMETWAGEWTSETDGREGGGKTCGKKRKMGVINKISVERKNGRRMMTKMCSDRKWREYDADKNQEICIGFYTLRWKCQSCCSQFEWLIMVNGVIHTVWDDIMDMLVRQREMSSTASVSSCPEGMTLLCRNEIWIIWGWKHWSKSSWSR